MVTYKHNRSAFHGGYQASEYSGIACLRCGSWWRTKAPYVESLKAFDMATEINLGPGHAGYEEQMEAWGRKPHREDARDR